MKLTLSKSAFAVTAILLGLAACADDAEPEPTATADAGAPATTVPPASTTPAPTATSAGVCPSSCTSDSECESMCPAISGAVQCCDTGTGMCYGSKTTCGPSTPDSGDPTPTY